MLQKILLLWAAFTAASQLGAQTLEPLSMTVQWGISAGLNQYKEPGLMRLKGPELGLHARFYRPDFHVTAPRWAATHFAPR